MRVFARKGYHASRVGDIAEEAGVAYGLLYHYFQSKEEVLLTVFRETWRALIATIRSVEEAVTRRASSCARWRRSCCARGGATRISCECSCWK